MTAYSNLKKPWRLLIAGVLSLLLIFFLLLLSISLLLSTNTGSTWVLSTIEANVSAVPNTQLQVGASSGTFLRGLNLQQLVFENEVSRTSVAELEARWNPWSVVSGGFYLSELTLSGLSVTLLETAEETTASSTDEFELFQLQALPISIEIAQLNLLNAQIELAQQIYQLDTLKLTAKLEGSTLSIEELSSSMQELTIEGELAVDLIEHYPLNAQLSWLFTQTAVEGIDELTGKLSLSGDLETLLVDHQLNLPLSLHSMGSINLGLFPDDSDGLQIDFSHSGDAIQLPLPQLQGYELPRLSLLSQGGLDSLELALELDLASELLPLVQVQAQAQTQGSKLELVSYALNTDTGIITGSAVLDWTEQITGSGSYQLSEANPLSYLTGEVPLQLSELFSNGEFSFEAQQENVNGSLIVESITAQVGDYPLQGSANVTVDNGVLIIEEIVRRQTILDKASPDLRDTLAHLG